MISPQLKRLQIRGYVNDEYITAVIKQTKNLEELEITHPSEQLTKRGLLQLIELKKLKRFHYNRFHWNETHFVASLMTAFSTSDVKLNYLHIMGVFIDHDGVKSIFNLKELEYLHLGDVECFSGGIISLARELPLLNTIRLELKPNCTSFAAIDLVNMVKVGKQLHKIELNFVQNFQINQDVFEELLEAASNRLNHEPLIIKLRGYDTMLIVPHDIQHGNRDKLQITFHNWNSNNNKHL